MLQPQQVTVFPAEHMFAIVQFGLRPDASKHHIRVCACLTAQFVFFSRAESGAFWQLSTFKCPLLRSPSINPPRAHVVGVSITVIMAWGLWKSLTSALLYIDVSVCPSSEALFFFGHLLSRFNHLEAPGLRQATPSVVSSPIDLSDALEALLELDD